MMCKGGEYSILNCPYLAEKEIIILKTRLPID